MVVLADLPGLNEDEIEVMVDDDMLTILAEPTLGRHRPEGRCRVGRSLRFLGVMRLPCSVDPDRMRVDLDDGVLTVRLPKRSSRQKS
ncbi:Hsp20/alpha crystallin family protein [Bradyrhizobium elkanii]|uniref:Hsp20/alpha crystallin family protein n=1 Tax=Bradyrhizobium elkanii TaxID=29448 RepID=UPI0018AD380A|nr:Hsp20/alpha crystallin family protein [Bradyrhizobium elkanii]MCS3450206.1 HSP20 family protein [Bradyrhizobium elkanii]MCS3558650.1 HSP20 family protein [Bradyrhizobium elkanii]MCW2151503.1 HSP20 family protein [Bradyrhizobium elkanii]MCW2358624.1 HSP20 family protein [Bradyrhizobium elkanii]MCW2375234.1 HSP20 family protein [Bradyrhizobium elkanii]